MYSLILIQSIKLLQVGFVEGEGGRGDGETGRIFFSIHIHYPLPSALF
jgi:hypothetical protein